MELWQGTFASLGGAPFDLLGLAMTIACGALLLSLILAVKLRSLTRPYGKIADGSADPGEIIPALVKAVEANRRSIDNLMGEVRQILYESRSYLKHVSLVRYDAFEDVGGQQSFSMCLLDSNRNGVLLTHLTGRNSTRGYAVSVSAGTPSRKLSDEETRALDDALKKEAVA